MPKILVAFFFFFPEQQQHWKNRAAEVCAGPGRGKGKQRGQLPLGWKASVRPERESRVQRRPRLPPEKRGHRCPARALLPRPSRHSVSSPDPRRRRAWHLPRREAAMLRRARWEQDASATAQQGPGEQGCSSGSAETSCARTPSAQASILVSTASGDALTEGVKEEQTRQQTQQTSRPAGVGGVEDGHRQRNVKHPEAGPGSTAPVGRTGAARALPPLHRAWRTSYWDNKSTSEPQLPWPQHRCLHTGTAAGVPPPAAFGPGSRGVGREPDCCPSG